MVTVNWFEGARRITQLFMASASLIGAYNAYFEFNPPSLQFTASTPRGEWSPNLPSPDAAEWEKDPFECSVSKDLWDFEIKPGLVRNLSLCFLPDEQGNIVYYSAAEEGEYLKRVEGAVAKATEAGDTKAIPVLAAEVSRLREVLLVQGSNNLSGNADDADVSEYVDLRVAAFEIDADTAAKIDKELPRLERGAFFEHAKEVLFITAYFVGGFWIFSFVMGWIIRGFAGIPRGQDFRPKSIAAAD